MSGNSETPSRPLTADEIRLAFSGPAVSANRVFANYGPGGVRLAFMEEEPETGTSHFRTAVVMSPQDALTLGEMLLGAIRREPVVPVEAAKPRIN